ncbi:hypothetical protein D478_13713 [Brevibacillus agri BAB-2500]|nr:hypothetical protein D478_13713 [Brevibacillus agri BAB-2500]
MNDSVREEYKQSDTLSIYNISLSDHIKNRKEKESIFMNRLARIIAQSPYEFGKQGANRENC